MVQGQPRFGGLVIGEVTINKLATTLKMEAKAAFVDPKTGQTHGWTTGNQWSRGTIAKMEELLAAMEGDMAMQHFERESADALMSAAPVTPSPGRYGPTKGLGEHVGGDDEQF